MLQPIRDRKIRIAVLGCGRISKNHFESIKKHHTNIELVAICDNDPVALDSHKNLDVPAFSELDTMLRSEQIDVVAICTPSGRHPQQTITCANHGVHVVTEKPMATRWSDGLKMVQACDDAGVRLFVVKQNRKNSTLQLLKRAVTEKRFGRIYSAHINVFWTRPQEYYDQAKWRGTWELDGGAFMNQASHYIDLIDWLIGPVETVQAMIGTLARDIQVEDTGVLNIRWRNGAIGSVAVSMLAYPKNYEGSITILGEKGLVRVGGVAVNEIQTWEFQDQREYDSDIESASYQTQSVYGIGHPLYYENVVECLRGECEPSTDGREGLKSLELLIASYLSARDGRAVSLPLSY